MGELGRCRRVCCRIVGGLDRALGSGSWSQLDLLDRDAGGATTFLKWQPNLWEMGSACASPRRHRVVVDRLFSEECATWVCTYFCRGRKAFLGESGLGRRIWGGASRVVLAWERFGVESSLWVS